MKTLKTILVLNALALASLGAAAAAEPSIVSLEIVPAAANLVGHNASQQLLLIGKTSAGAEIDLTDKADWSVAGSSAARLDGARLFSVADGAATVHASAAGRSVEAAVKVSGSADEKPFSFARDIGGILTRRGCNGSGCHGGVKGQAGYKLSKNAIHPHEDYKWTVEGGVFQVLSDESGGPREPRVSLRIPAASLLLQKATMEIAHGGGPRFEKGSDDYNVILSWIEAGAPFGEEASGDEAKLVRLETYPSELVLDPGQSRRVLVTAFYDDGRQEDFTHQVLYEVNETEIASVGADGRVEARKPGETAILIKAAGRNARIGVGVVGAGSQRLPQSPDPELYRRRGLCEAPAL
jgi:hypothetical protein